MSQTGSVCKWGMHVRNSVCIMQSKNKMNSLGPEFSSQGHFHSLEHLNIEALQGEIACF